MKFRELMKSLVPWPFRQTGRLKICAYCGLRASAFGFPWPAAEVLCVGLSPRSTDSSSVECSIASTFPLLGFYLPLPTTR
ncbi:MAG: hypothetical protein GY782_00170 [Gammaproteobacteria bacterium]|nr:hypothetical protein [Gammaproteobacteria bacterium]